MTSPTLSPAEQTEVDRFGAHDEDVLAWLDDQDEVLCLRRDAAATASIITRCCGAAYLICDQHLTKARAHVELSRLLRCRTCHRKVPGGDFDACYRVVPL